MIFRSSQPAQISVQQLHEELQSDQPPALLDVRQPEEYDLVRLESAQHIPLGELRDRLEELDASRRWVVYCKSGRRSAKAVAMLAEQGFAEAVNLTGGILDWVDQVQPELPRY